MLEKNELERFLSSRILIVQAFVCHESCTMICHDSGFDHVLLIFFFFDP